MNTFSKYFGLLSLASAGLLSASFVMAPATAHAEVDLSGTYNIATLTPLQRPKQFGDKATITPKEAKEIAEYWASNLAKDQEKSDPDRDAPPEGGVEIYVPEFEGAAGGVGGYNAFYVDIGESNFKGFHVWSRTSRSCNVRINCYCSIQPQHLHTT